MAGLIYLSTEKIDFDEESVTELSRKSNDLNHAACEDC